MDLICKRYNKKISEQKAQILEKEVLIGLYEIIDRMYKHAIEDYIHVIGYQHYRTEKYYKVYIREFNSMFEHIADDFKWRLKDLKEELTKKMKIELPTIDKSNESDSKSDSESDSESEDESEDESDNESEDESKLQHFITIGKYKLSENCPLKNLSEAELDEKFKKFGLIRGFKDVKSDCELSQKEPDPEINQKLNSDQMT